MTIRCLFLGHVATADQIWNFGYAFSRCGRCGRDIIHGGDGWRSVPRGHRVVWKPGIHRHSVPADYRRTLPVLYRESTTRGQPSLAAWNRQLLLLADHPDADPRALALLAADETEGAEEAPYPFLLPLALIVGTALEALLRLSPRRGFE